MPLQLLAGFSHSPTHSMPGRTTSSHSGEGQDLPHTGKSLGKALAGSFGLGLFAANLGWGSQKKSDHPERGMHSLGDLWNIPRFGNATLRDVMDTQETTLLSSSMELLDFYS